MSFIDDVNEQQERKIPVRRVVKANAVDIQAARAAGKSLNAIYRALKRKGHEVGKGYSSFRNAVNYLDKHGWPEMPAPIAAKPSSPSASAPVAPAAAPAPRDRFVDNRFDSDF